MAKSKQPEHAEFSLSDVDESTLLGCLRLGLGLSHACHMVHQHPKDISKRIRENAKFQQSCQESIKYAARLLLVTAQKNIADEEYAKLKKTRNTLHAFITELVLWEDYCQRDTVTPEVFLRATAIYKTKADCATALGMTPREFVEYISSFNQLAIYMASNEIYDFG